MGGPWGCIPPGGYTKIQGAYKHMGHTNVQGVYKHGGVYKHMPATKK